MSNHLIIALPPNQDILKKVNELIFTFIWSSPVHRVKKELLQKDFTSFQNLFFTKFYKIFFYVRNITITKIE
jgi:hypothetical protein